MLSSKPAGPAQGEKLAKSISKKRSGTIDDIDFLVEEELSRKSELEDIEMESTTAIKVEISSKPTEIRRQSTPASITLPVTFLDNPRTSMEESISVSGESKMFKELFTTANKSKGIAGIAFEPEP
jgi:hypothetical protein